MANLTSSILLGAGCFWCTEAVFKDLRGIISVTPGYGGGIVENPTYEAVCSEKTGHAELVRVVFDPAEITLEDLLRIFFTTHDPTQTDGQGHDLGTRYRSVISGNKAQQETACKIRDELTAQSLWPAPIVTEIHDEVPFWPAETYHHDYFSRNPEQAYCAAVIAPKLAKARKYFRDRLKNPEIS